MPRQPLQPEATGAVMEATKMAEAFRSRIGGRTSAQAVTQIVTARSISVMLWGQFRREYKETMLHANRFDAR